MQWTTDVEEAFQKMEKIMEILPKLTALIKGEVLLMYLTASVESISAVLLKEGKKWKSQSISRLRREHNSAKKQIPKDSFIEMPSKEDEKMVARKMETKKVPRRPTTLSKKYMKALVDLTWNLALWTLPRNSQNETPFALTYGLEAIIPSDATLIPESKENTIKAKRKEGEEREVASIEEAY
ncbi:hypothetical protein Tco_0520392 [Tanacetum coccineum]